MHGVGVDIGIGGDTARARRPDAFACAIKRKAMVAAFNSVALAAALRERQLAV